MPDPQIVAMGGFPDDTLLDYVLEVAGGKRVPYVPTAGMEDPSTTVWWYGRLRERARMTHLHFSPWPPGNLRELALGQDVIVVTGGNTANALAIWRAHGFDEILREAWEHGVVLAGWSAGMICWYEHGVTDSFGRSSQRWNASASCPAARVPITTVRSVGVRCTRGSSRTAWRAASPSTTTSHSITSGRSYARSSRRGKVRRRIASDATARNGSMPSCCSERRGSLGETGPALGRVGA